MQFVMYKEEPRKMWLSDFEMMFESIEVVKAPDPGVLDLMLKNDEEDVIPEAEYLRNPNKPIRKNRAYRRRQARKHGSDYAKNNLSRQYKRLAGWGDFGWNISDNDRHWRNDMVDNIARCEIREYLKDSETPVSVSDNSEYIQKLNHIKAEIWRYNVDFGNIDVSLGTIGDHGMLDGAVNV